MLRIYHDTRSNCFSVYDVSQVRMLLTAYADALSRCPTAVDVNSVSTYRKGLHAVNNTTVPPLAHYHQSISCNPLLTRPTVGSEVLVWIPARPWARASSASGSTASSSDNAVCDRCMQAWDNAGLQQARTTCFPFSVTLSPHVSHLLGPFVVHAACSATTLGIEAPYCGILRQDLRWSNWSFP